MSELKTGKKPATYSKHDFLYADFRTGRADTTAGSVPASFGYGTKLKWQMLGNGPDDSVAPGFGGAGDCVWAGAFNDTGLSEKVGGRPVAPFSGKEAIAAYSEFTGYEVGNDFTDHGTDVRQAMSQRQHTGIKDANGVRHKIGAYLSIEPGNWNHFVEAMWVLDFVGIGINFPTSAMDQFNAGKIWSYVPGAANEGGHYVTCVGRRIHDHVDLITWAKKIQMTRQFFEKQTDEIWGILMPESLNATTGKTARGVDMTGLNQELARLRQP